MTIDELIEIIKLKNPQLERETVTMTSENFIKAIRFAYNAGKNSPKGDEIFNKLFGN